MSKRKCFFLIFFIYLAAGASAIEYAIFYPINDSTQIGITGSPYASYMSESGLGAGLSLIFFEKSIMGKKSIQNDFNMRLTGEINADKKQEFAIKGRLPLRKYHSKIALLAEYKKHDLEYWGIGGNTPQNGEVSFGTEHYILSGSIERFLMQNISLGLAWDFSGYDNTIDTKYLADDLPAGATGFYRSIGFGGVFNYSTKYPNNFPVQGLSYQNKLLFYEKALVSDFQFVTWQQDFQYFYCIGSHIIASQILSLCTFGDRPLHYYPSQGGSSFMRGQKTDRYKDKHLVGGQTEYRSPIIFWRVSAVGFVSTAVSYQGCNDFITENIHFTGGG
ncbi:MAG: hypothetical protein FWG20_06315, partial [Candidatus Cloacimonetes bacterium]|nr:hypothetical protein [Candidatus Cloacimonadota bacterium]